MAIKFSVIIPTRNEEANLEALTPLLDLFDEVIFIDGNSSDGTLAMIESLFPTARILNQAKLKGKGSAIMLGLLDSTGDFTFVVDADMPVSFQEMISVQKLCSNSVEIDLIKSSRFLQGGGSEDLTKVRSFGARSLAFLARKIHRVDWSEICYGFWAIRRERVAELNLQLLLNSATGFYPFHKLPYGHSFEFDQVIFLRALYLRFKILEIPSFELSRRNGDSGLFAPFDGLRTLMVLITEKYMHD
jgi:glycosyltransferase involved in cell wall biosynthesis